MSDECGFDLASVFDHKRGSACDRRIVRQCRLEGPAACDRAATCDRTCDTVAGECLIAFGDPIECLRAYGRCVADGGLGCSTTPTANGCNRTIATDFRGVSTIHVIVDTVPDRVIVDERPTGYEDVSCFLVSLGTVVRFKGIAPDTPLYGGEAPTPDPTSPFATSSTTDDGARELVLSAPGIYPYFQKRADGRYATGAWGAVIVDDVQ